METDIVNLEELIAKTGEIPDAFAQFVSVTKGVALESIPELRADLENRSNAEPITMPITTALKDTSQDYHTKRAGSESDLRSVIDTFNSNEKTQENMKSALNDILDRIETQRKELRTQLADMDRKVEERVNAIKPAQQNVNGVSIQAQQEIQQAREATEKVTAEFQKKMEEAEKRHQEQTKAMQQQMQQMQQQMQQQVQQAQQQLQQAQQQSMDQARDTSENAEEESSGGGGGGGGGGSMNQETNQTVDAQLEMMMQIFMELFFGLDSLIVIFDDMDGMLGAWPGDIDMALMDVNDSMIEFETALIASNDGDITVISGL